MLHNSHVSEEVDGKPWQLAAADDDLNARLAKAYSSVLTVTAATAANTEEYKRFESEAGNYATCAYKTLSCSGWPRE